MPVEKSLVLGIAVLDSLIRVVKERSRWFCSLNGFPQGTESEILVQFPIVFPTNDFPGVKIHDHREIEPSFLSGDIGDIRAPDDIWFFSLEFLVQQVGNFLEGMG